MRGVKLRVQSSGNTVRLASPAFHGTISVCGKNTTIADDSVVGWGSTVHGRFTEPASVISGNPAVVRNSGVTWDSDLVSLHQEGARILTEKDWMAAAPAPLLLRPFRYLRLALCRARVRYNRRPDKRAKYTRQAEKLRKRLER